MWRPAIDVLFRSAAVTYRSRVIGVLLSGYLDDGNVGLQAIGTCGGVTIVQEPQESEISEMPRIAVANVSIDYVLSVPQIAATLVRLANEAAPPEPPIPQQLQLEARIAATAYGDSSLAAELGKRTAYSCPECNGPIWQRVHDPLSFRCAVGHAFVAESLLEHDRTQLESSLWVAVRLLEQRSNVVRDLAAQAGPTTRRGILYRERASEAAAHAQTLRKLLQSVGDGAQIEGRSS
jgi:two-component system chemotaxis response regulator CheB